MKRRQRNKITTPPPTPMPIIAAFVSTGPVLEVRVGGEKKATSKDYIQGRNERENEGVNCLMEYHLIVQFQTVKFISNRVTSISQSCEMLICMPGLGSLQA